MATRKFCLVAIQASVVAGTAFLFFAISTANIDGLPMPSLVFYSVTNFIVFSIPTIASLYFLFLIRYDLLAIFLSGAFVVYWVFDIYFRYKMNDYNCTYWHQGDFLCSSFDYSLSLLIAADYALLLVAIGTAVSAKLFGTRPGLDHLGFATFVAVVLAVDWAIIIMAV